MSEPDHQKRDAAEAGLDRLLDLARSAPVPGLSPDLMRKLMADAAANQTTRARPAPLPASVSRRPGVLSTVLRGLEQVFGGMPGLAGAGLATGMAFALGVFLPEKAINLVGFASALELAENDLSSLEIAADPSLLWTEE